MGSLWRPDRIYYHPRLPEHAAAWERAQNIFAHFPDITPEVFPGVPEGRIGDIIDWGKKTLYLGLRARGQWVRTFTNHEPGSFCPSFVELNFGSQCVFDCAYCFLQQTYRARWPMVSLYLNWEDMEADIQTALAERQGRPTVFNTGELTDPLALDHLTGLAPYLARRFAREPNACVLFLTKSSNVEGLLRLSPDEHRRHTIVAWSLNCQRVADEVEIGTATLPERLRAAQAVQQAGYRVRVRIDPLIWFSDWREQYAGLVDSIYRHVRPEMITLGSYRRLNQLDAIIQQRFPHSLLHDAPARRVAIDGARERYPLDIRLALYRHVLQCIREHDPDVPVSLCKEDLRCWAVLQREGFLKAACNCLPHPDWQAVPGGMRRAAAR